MANLAPIVLFVYNRPEHTRRTLDALAANPLADESDLIIYADGPKKPEHAATIEQARAVARTASGFKSVTMIERDSNLGLANSIISGVTEVCKAKGKVIVIEDDLIVAPQFLTFLNRGLDRYENEPNVFQVSGYMFPIEFDKTEPSFLPLTTTWGWATWKRAWDAFEPSLSHIGELEKDGSLRRRFDLNGSYQFFDMAKRQQRAIVDSWGIRWYMTVFFLGGLVLYPGRSFVKNIGADGSGTHGVLPRQFHKRPSDGSKFSFDAMPAVIQVDGERMQAVEYFLRSMQPTRVRRIIGWLRQQISARLRATQKLEGERS